MGSCNCRDKLSTTKDENHTKWETKCHCSWILFILLSIFVQSIVVSFIHDSTQSRMNWTVNSTVPDGYRVSTHTCQSHYWRPSILWKLPRFVDASCLRWWDSLWCMFLVAFPPREISFWPSDPHNTAAVTLHFLRNGRVHLSITTTNRNFPQAQIRLKAFSIQVWLLAFQHWFRITTIFRLSIHVKFSFCLEALN